MVLLFCPHDGDGFELGEPYIVFSLTGILRHHPVKYKGGEIVNGQLKGGKVARIKIVTKTLPPKPEAAKWLLERRFPEKWGPRAKGDAHEREARSREPIVVLYTPDNGGG